MSTTTELTDRLDALLPQTQCTRCGYPTCRAYAQAIASGEADVDRCPPGGADGVAALAALLGRAVKPLNPDCGVERPPLVAVIDEAVCIGCTKCIRACPVDAIVGAAKRMHTVIAAECTGCELCLPPCPVDCIRLVQVAERRLSRAGVLERAKRARERYEAHNRRVAEPITSISRASRVIATNSSDNPDCDSITRTKAGIVPASILASTEDTQPPMINRTAVLEAIARGKAKLLKIK